MQGGRLEEAASVLGKERARKHCEGQRLIGELVDLLVQRGTIHLEAGRLIEARQDAELARQFGGSQLAVSKLIYDVKDRMQRDRSEPIVSGSPVVPPPVAHAVLQLLQVDGLGRLPICRSATLTVGSVSAPRQTDFRLQTPGPSVPVTFARDGEDWFASSSESFVVNGQATYRRLLMDGDLVLIGQRGRIRYRKSVAASGTAVLELTGASLPMRDIRQLVLMGDCLLLGEGNTHFPVAKVHPPILVQPQTESHSMSLRASGGPTVILNPGQRVVAADVGFYLRELQPTELSSGVSAGTSQ